MNIKAIFPAGVTALTVNGLHQWDYGRALEIHADDLPSQVEVHFACPGMKDAVVRECNATDGVATAVIPDTCLEQTAPITAWVFVIDNATGVTTKTITLPVIERARPQPGGTVPEEYTDRYTELITGVNAAIGQLTSGAVKAGCATKADAADHATTADTATTANHALTADSSGPASLAEAVRLIGQEYGDSDTLVPGLYYVDAYGYDPSYMDSSLEIGFSAMVPFFGSTAYDSLWVKVPTTEPGCTISVSSSGFSATVSDGKSRKWEITATLIFKFKEAEE